MKKLFLALMVLVSAGAYAQNGVTNDYRFGQGEDSIRCIEAISISQVNIKTKEYNIAYPNWKIVFTEFPVARGDTYTNGIKMLTEMIKLGKEISKKMIYVSSLG